MDLKETLDVPLPTVVAKVAEEEPDTVGFLILIKSVGFLILIKPIGFLILVKYVGFVILIKPIGFGNWQPINHQQPLQCID